MLDCVGSSMYETNVNVLAMDGKWVVYGTMGKLISTTVVLSLFS